MLEQISDKESRRIDRQNDVYYSVCVFADGIKVVEEIFGDSIHREVVGRSTKLLRFLSSMEGALTTAHLDLIWMSCVGKAEPELQVSVTMYSMVFNISRA